MLTHLPDSGYSSQNASRPVQEAWQGWLIVGPGGSSVRRLQRVRPSLLMPQVPEAKAIQMGPSSSCLPHPPSALEASEGDYVLHLPMGGRQNSKNDPQDFCLSMPPWCAHLP
jgi:hypothetical protein